MFDWKWNLSDIKQDKDVSVFSCFACGGGSSMGYKRAGFKVLGCCEIDPRMNKVYVKNLHPKYNYLMDIRDFNKQDMLPEELYHLDILDGSPPCSTFSTSGLRERAWGVEKQFREGQKKQTLDDLFFVFLETVERLKPKIVIAENVAGLLKGNAKGYVHEIIAGFRGLGYDVQLFDLFASRMNVPQNRERVFFIANSHRYPKLKLDFNEKPVTFGEVRSETGKVTNGKHHEYALMARRGEKTIADVKVRFGKKGTGFTESIFWDNEIAATLKANGCYYRRVDGMYLSKQDIVNISTFPQDYDFMDQNPQYICGMSVPPNMTANIATQVYEQWLRK